MRDMMMRALVLSTAVALAAACGGVAPTDPTPLTPNPPAAVSANLTNAAGAGQDCSTITGVEVRVAPSLGSAEVSVLATYLFNGPGQACTIPPSWAASRPGLVVNPVTPFRASIARASGKTTVTAASPNGITGSITF